MLLRLAVKLLDQWFYLFPLKGISMFRVLSTVVLFASLIITGLHGSAAYAAEIKADKTEAGTVIIWVSGEIKNGDDAKFRRLSIEHKDAIVVLDSDGGQLMPALEIGKIIRLAGYTTMVGNDFVCTSSCALIWLAGSPRFLEAKGKVGFHASYRDINGKFEETGVGNAVIGHYLSMLNLPQRAVVFATTASPTEIIWLTAENAKRSGIDFQTIGDNNNSLAEAEPTSAPRVAASKAPPIVRTVTPPPVIRTVSTPPPVITTVSVPTRATTDISLDQLKSIIRKTYQSPGYIQSILSTLDINPTSRAAMIEHAKILYADKRLTDRLATELYEARGGLSGGEGDKAIGMSIGQAINVKLTLNGLSRLSDKDVKLYLLYISSIVARATDAECKAILTGKDEFGRIELRLLTELGQASFTDYLALTRKAITAELSNDPRIVPLTSEANAGQSSFENYLAEELEKLSKTERERLGAAMASLDTANDKDSCDGYYMIFKTALDMGGLPGAWQRRTMVNAMGK